MQLNECNYCGAILAPSVFKCTNCGGQIKQNTSAKNKKIYRKRIAGLLLLVVVASPIIYKIHLANTTKAVVAKLQTNLGGAAVGNATINSNDFLIKAKFIQALVSVTSIKLVVMEFLLTEGRYPETLQELGFNQQSFETGEFIQAIQLSKNGSIRVDLAANAFDKKKFFILTPKQIMGGMNIQWSCTSNLKQHLLSSQCQSVN